jgi:hypothetical protein
MSALVIIVMAVVFVFGCMVGYLWRDDHVGR